MTKRQPETATDRREGMGRRQALAGLGAAGIASALAACGQASPDDARTTTSPSADPSTTSAATPIPTADAEQTPTPTEEPADGDGGQVVLGVPADIPVGGGTVYPEQKVVVTQPEEGTFHGFTAVCTHQGCLVNSVSDGLIHCPCHQSAFKISDGSVENGPAAAPLAAVELDVARDKIALIEG